MRCARCFALEVAKVGSAMCVRARIRTRGAWSWLVRLARPRFIVVLLFLRRLGRELEPIETAAELRFGVERNLLFRIVAGDVRGRARQAVCLGAEAVAAAEA